MQSLEAWQVPVRVECEADEFSGLLILIHPPFNRLYFGASACSERRNGAERPIHCLPDSLERMSTLRKVFTIGLEFVVHVFPHIQSDGCALGSNDVHKITDHVHKNLFATRLDVDRAQPPKVLMNR